MSSTHDNTNDALHTELLVVRCRLGERAAWDELVDAWHPRLWRYARRLAGDDAGAEEITQETWLRVLRGLPRLREPRKLGSWILGIAHHVLTDRLRARYAAPRRSEVDIDTLEGAASAGDGVDRLADRRSVERALARLPLLECEVTLLFYLEELPQADIADLLGVPVGTVKSRLHRARRLLRRALEDLGERPREAPARTTPNRTDRRPS